MNRTEHALQLAEEALAELELGDGRLTPIVLKCLRLARLLENEEAEEWFRLELRGYSAKMSSDGNWGKFASWSGREGIVNPEGQQLYWPYAIEVIESDLQIARQDLLALQLPSISANDTGSQQTISKFTKTASEQILSAVMMQRNLKAADVRKWTKIVSSLRGAIDDWLTGLVADLRYGEIVETAFERSRARFDALLAKHAPEVGKKLSSAYRRADSDDPEEWSQALTSCRRALKALADILYPPTAVQVDGHSLGEQEYRNRLIRFVKDARISNSQTEFITIEIERVVDRVEALDSLASKGVHSDVDVRDLELTIVHTYLLAGQLVELIPEPSPPVDATSEPADTTTGAVLSQSPTEN